MAEDLFPMKHLIFLIVATLLGGLGSIYHPFWGILLYYTLAVLRPQYLWQWALPMELRWSLFASIIVFVSLAINSGRGFFRLKLQLMPLLIMTFLFLLLGSAINAYYPNEARYWMVEYAKILGMALVASVVIDKLWQIRAIFIMIVMVLGYIAWEINYLYIFEGRLDIYHKGYGGLDNNGAGLMLAMGVPLAYAFAVSAKNRLVRLGCWFAAILMLHAMLMSYSRGAMLAMIVGGLWVLLHHRPRFHAGMIAIVAVIAISLLAGQEIRDRFMSSENYNSDGSAQSRIESWNAGWEIALDNPLFGQGIRNSKYFIFNYGADRQGRTIHSQYIQLAADSGIPALLVYITILGATFVYLRRTRRACRQYLTDFDDEHHHDAHRPDFLTQQTVSLTLGCEGSMLIFAFGAVFLSLEIVELPWILMVMAGIFPQIVSEHIQHLQGVGAHRHARDLQETLKANQRLEQGSTYCPIPAIIRGLLVP